MNDRDFDKKIDGFSSKLDKLNGIGGALIGTFQIGAALVKTIVNSIKQAKERYQTKRTRDRRSNDFK